ncbi:MAG: NTP transferase domain-containing protein [Bdellovibrio sp.]
MGQVNYFSAIYLAAGHGSRISALTHRPKCLLKLNQESLLERSFRIWKSLGIKDVVLVLGYEADMIRNIAQNYEMDFNISYKLNADYKKQGNTFSLYLGIEDVNNTSLIFDADLIYDEVVLKDFINHGHHSEILVGAASINDIECAKTLIDDKQFARMTVDKRAISDEELKKYQFAGEAIGILKFSQEHTRALKQNAEKFLKTPGKLHLNWEHLLNEFLQNHDVGIFKIKEGRSIEIDTPEDFQRAREIFEG